MQKPSEALHALIKTGHKISNQGWVPATSGNLSTRADDESIWVTASGLDKGALTLEDFLSVDASGKPHIDKKPSAETLLHTQIYQHQPNARFVLHTHPASAVLISKRTHKTHEYGAALFEFDDYELVKAFPGVSSHIGPYRIPIFANDQNIPRLTNLIEPFFQHLATEPPGYLPAYLLRGHGLYTWADTAKQAFIQLEALEEIMRCELQLYLYS